MALGRLQRMVTRRPRATSTIHTTRPCLSANNANCTRPARSTPVEINPLARGDASLARPTRSPAQCGNMTARQGRGRGGKTDFLPSACVFRNRQRARPPSAEKARSRRVTAKLKREKCVAQIYEKRNTSARSNRPRPNPMAFRRLQRMVTRRPRATTTIHTTRQRLSANNANCTRPARSTPLEVASWREAMPPWQGQLEARRSGAA